MANWAFEGAVKRVQGVARGAGLALLGVTASAAAFAQEPLVGQPTPGGIGLQPGVTEVKAQIGHFHDFLLVIITAITLFVLALLVWVAVRYNRRANPEPRKFSHNTLVEVVWTVIPVLILVVIATQSFPLLAKEERIPPNADVTIKAIGNSWFWTHDLPDYGVSVTSNVLSKEDATAQNKPYLLGTDGPVLVPVGATVRMLVTSSDVIHSWTIPAFGVKEDAIPGRVNEGWFRAEKEGVFYGQCSELCGIRHAYMPIEFHVVSQAAFNAWIKEQGGTIPGEAPAEPAPAPAPPAEAPAPEAAPATP